MHREFITLDSLNLTENDFKFKLLKIHDYEESFVGYKIVTVSVNDCEFSFSFHASIDLIQDIRLNGFDFFDIAENIIKTESIFNFINDVKQIRKSKLKKLKKIND